MKYLKSILVGLLIGITAPLWILGVMVLCVLVSFFDEEIKESESSLW